MAAITFSFTRVRSIFWERNDQNREKANTYNSQQNNSISTAEENHSGLNESRIFFMAFKSFSTDFNSLCAKSIFPWLTSPSMLSLFLSIFSPLEIIFFILSRSSWRQRSMDWANPWIWSLDRILNFSGNSPFAIWRRSFPAWQAVRQSYERQIEW